MIDVAGHRHEQGGAGPLPALLLLLAHATPFGCGKPGPEAEEPTVEAAPVAWNALAPGLELARPRLSDVEFTVLRVDPARWDLVLMSANPGMTARQWCQTHDLVAATNGGMFDTDYQTHVGRMVIGDQAGGTPRPDYESVAVFGPRAAGLPPFAIHDLDASGTDLLALENRYTYLVQNLRLIKKPGENRWSRQERQWSEAALAEDSRGRALLVFTRAPLSMHEFNESLLASGLDVVAAQHLDGGPPAQLYLEHGEHRFDGIGSYETGAFENDDNRQPWTLPFVLGVRAKGG